MCVLRLARLASKVEGVHDYFVGRTSVLVHNGRVGRHKVGPYSKVRWHHPHQQAARSNNPNYKPRKALSVAAGTYNHKAISTEQIRLNNKHLKSGKPYTLKVEEQIQRQSMKKGGFTNKEIDKILEKSRATLKSQGALNPTRTPGDC
jgi:hypothetical protein